MKKVLKTLGVYCFMAIWTIFTAPITIVAFITWCIHGGPRKLNHAAHMFALQSSIHKYELAIAAYNTTKRHIKVEVFKVPSEWAFSSADEMDVRMGISSAKRELNKWLRINVNMLDWAGEWCIPAQKAYDLINNKLKSILTKYLQIAYA